MPRLESRQQSVHLPVELFAYDDGAVLAFLTRGCGLHEKVTRLALVVAFESVAE